MNSKLSGRKNVLGMRVGYGPVRPELLDRQIIGRLYFFDSDSKRLTKASSLSWQRRHFGVSWKPMTVTRNMLNISTKAPLVKYRYRQPQFSDFGHGREVSVVQLKLAMLNLVRYHRMAFGCLEATHA